MTLQPGDNFGRRERGFALATTGKFEPGIAELKWFLARRPDDAVGHYELALALMPSDPAQALVHLDRAVALKADFVGARSARGSLYYRQGKPETALTDLEFAARLQPDDPVTLDRLGQTYLALDRPADAGRVLRKAAAFAPSDSRIQLHLGRALADAGQTAESKTAMDRFRQLGPEKNRRIPPGLVDYLGLTPEQQRADYRARVEKAVADHPEDAAAEARYLQLLLDDGKSAEAVAVARRIAGLKPDAAVIAGAGRALLEARQYAASRELLEQAAAESPTADVRLNLALAALHSGGPADGLRQLDRVPEAERGGDFYLARAQMMEAAGRSGDAGTAIEQALRAAPMRSDLYQQAAVLLTGNGRTAEALRLLDRAVPDREILLAKATTMELAGRTQEAARLVNQVQNRWPEWPAGWVAQGIILQSRGRFEEARQTLETAFALGAHSAEAWHALADCSLHSVPKRIDAAETAIRRALELAPDDGWVQYLAGRILLERRQYGAAVERLREALRLRPGLIPALQSLAEAYGALGRKEEALAARQQPGDASGPREFYRLFLSKPPRDW
ncbi:MAG: tetratricopeptide repeat protein [Candidatus Solibacter sp.]|nr:tetratricopeptide repeat protein [Candidatus Solibacter sp.]